MRAGGGDAAAAEDAEAATQNATGDAAAAEKVPRADAWGYAGEGDHGEPAGREARRRKAAGDGARKKVEGDPGVRAARAALEALKGCPPDLEGPDLAPDLDFMSERARHIYGTEIAILIDNVEQGLKSLAVSRGMQWLQAMMSALRRGVAL